MAATDFGLNGRPRMKPKGGRLSLRAISAELAARGVLNERIYWR
jgi:hypothetical protein